MSKNLLQDMIKVKQIRQEIRVNQKEVKNQDKNGPRYKLWFVAAVSVVFFLFALSYLFSKVVVTVNPKINEVILNENLSASKEANTDALSFDLVILPGEEIQTVQSSEEKDIFQKAQGVVVIYNAFSSASQMLSIDTRLEGSNGKIYKTQTKTTVPGINKDGKPGSIEVKIYGAEAGEEYNSVPLDFKIFGFKGSLKYSKFYARSKGAITGGFKGKSPVISDEKKASLANELKANLQTKLLQKATDQIPDGFILFKNGFFFDAEDINIDFTSFKDNILPVKLKGTLYGLLFNENKLTKKIAENNIEKYDGSEIYIPNVRDLSFSLTDKDNTLFKDMKNINFNLSGAIKIVWKLDVEKLINDLLGKSKKDFNQILLQYPYIDSAESELSPFWKMSFPDNTKDIKVIVNYPK